MWGGNAVDVENSMMVNSPIASLKRRKDDADDGMVTRQESFDERDFKRLRISPQQLQQQQQQHAHRGWA